MPTLMIRTQPNEAVMTHIRILFLLAVALTPAVTWAQASPTNATGIGATPAGYEVTDPVYGLKAFTADQKDWDALIKGSDDYTHLTFTHYPEKSTISVRKAYQTSGTPQEIHDKSLELLTSTLPGAVFWKKGEKITLGGVEAVSSTYKNPATLEVTREVFFQNKGVNYQMLFEFKEADFEKIKNDLAYFMQNLSFIEPTSEGGEIRDLLLGLGLKAPSQKWRVQAIIDGVKLSFYDADEYFTDIVVNFYKLEYKDTTLAAAYETHVKKMNEEYDGLTVMSEKLPLKLNGAVDAMTFTFKHPTKRIVNRDVIFMHKGTPTLINFSMAESRFEKHKADLATILNKGILIF